MTSNLKKRIEAQNSEVKLEKLEIRVVLKEVLM